MKVCYCYYSSIPQGLNEHLPWEGHGARHSGHNGMKQEGPAFMEP